MVLLFLLSFNCTLLGSNDEHNEYKYPIVLVLQEFISLTDKLYSLLSSLEHVLQKILSLLYKNVSLVFW